MNTPKEVEYGFFGCLLDFGGMSITVNLAAAMQEGANEAWFDEKRCRLAWAAVESLWKSGFNGENPNAVMILAEAQHIAAAPKSPHRGVVLDGTFLDEAAKYGRTREDIRAYAKELRNAAMARRASARLMEAMDALGKESDSAHVVSSLVSDLNGIRQKESSVQELSMKDLTASVMKTFDTAHEQYVVKRNYDYVTGIPLLWRAVSRRMDGIQPGVTIVAARPSVGKSSFVLAMLLDMAAKGYHCAFNCIDMAAKMICQRPFSTLTGIPLNRLKSGVPEYPEYRERLMAAKRTLDAWDDESRFKILHKNNIDDFKAWCIMRKQQGLLDVVAVDYVQQLTASGRYSSTNERMEYISSQLKDLATQYDLPVVVLSQLSRDNVKDKNGEREPTMADLRGSGALEQDAFAVILLFVDDGTNNSWQDGSSPMCLVPGGDPDTRDALKPVWVKIEKNQNGGRGRFPFVVYQNTFTWYLGDKDALGGAIGAKNATKFQRITPDGRDKAFEEAVAAMGGCVTPQTAPAVQGELE